MEKTTTIAQLVYTGLIIPLVAFIAVQTYYINAAQSSQTTRLEIIEKAQVKSISRQETIITNQILLCNYAEPTWPTHAKCERDFK